MCKRVIGAFVCVLLLVFCVFAQHGKSQKGGLYTFNYKGDTWTGEIVAFDPATREISLQYTDKKGQTEKFTAKLKPGAKATVKNRPEERIASLNSGDRIIAYYIATGQKYFVEDEKGKKKEVVATENIIFEIEVIPANKDKK